MIYSAPICQSDITPVKSRKQCKTPSKTYEAIFNHTPLTKHQYPAPIIP